MQITLDDDRYDRLRREAERTGASIAELIRRAVDRSYGQDLTLEEKLRILDATAGALGEEFGQRMDEQERLRRQRAQQRIDER